jgi:hypothetical protein
MALVYNSSFKQKTTKSKIKNKKHTDLLFLNSLLNPPLTPLKSFPISLATFNASCTSSLCTTAVTSFRSCNGTLIVDVGNNDTSGARKMAKGIVRRRWRRLWREVRVDMCVWRVWRALWSWTLSLP